MATQLGLSLSIESRSGGRGLALLHGGSAIVKALPEPTPVLGLGTKPGEAPGAKGSPASPKESEKTAPCGMLTSVEYAVPGFAVPRRSFDEPDDETCPAEAPWIEAIQRHYDRAGAPSREGWRYDYYRRIAKRLAHIVEPGSRVLDIGCGSGDLLASLRPSVGVGVDLSATVIAQARRRHPGLNFVRLRGEQIDRLGQTFDYIVICQSLGEIYDLQRLFRAVREVCHPRTRLVIVHYNRLWQPVLRLAEWLGLKGKTPEQNWLPAEEVNHLLHLSGFDPVRTFGMNLMPLRIPFAAAMVNRIAGNLPLLHALGLNYVTVARPLGLRFARMKENPSVTIAVPARNEAGHITALLRRIPQLAPRQEIIFVEGGSVDDTQEVIERAVREYNGPMTVQWLKQDGTGKGDAVRQAFEHATGDVLMILDADISVPPEELPAFYDALCSGKGEFINGSRMVYLMDRKAMRFLNLLANKAFGWLFTYLVSQPFRDTLCGTKILLRQDYERIARNRSYFGDFDPFGDFDLIFGAARLNLRIVEVPVHYKARTYGTTNISRFRHGWLLLRMCAVAACKLRFI